MMENNLSHAKEAEQQKREDSPAGSEVEKTTAQTNSASGAERKTEPPSGGIFQQMWRRFQEERNRSKPAQAKFRGQENMDRSKAFLVLATVIVLAGFAFLVLFSTSGSEKRAQERRTKPSLGRTEAARKGGRSGSAIPLLSADQSGTDQNSDQLSPDDILATSRRSQSTPPQQEQKGAKNSDQYGLRNLPPVNDPALDAYRIQNHINTPPPVPALKPSVAPPVTQAANDSDALKKSSLVFVRNVASTAAAATASAPESVERRPASLLPTGSRLVARLQTAVSSAVKTPAIAVIEYNYERDGEIVIPAGTKAIGQMTQANQNGQVGLRFNALEMPDGTTETIEGTGVALDFGPLKGSVNGQNRVKRVLVRSLTGISSMAAYLVGGPGYNGLTGPVDQSILLRERLASNVGLAGEQEMMGLAYNQNVVVTIAGNTRFYIVLQEPSSAPKQSEPAARTNTASADAQALPTAAELQELMALKDELNRMYQEVGATRGAATTSPQQ